MKLFQLLLLLAFAQISFAKETQNSPNEDSIRELLTLARVKDTFEDALVQVESIIDDSITQMFGEQEMTEETQNAQITLRQKMAALIQEEFNWDFLEGLYLDVYAKSFTQAEIDSILTFYQSEGGQAVLKKMPALMQHTISHLQNQMTSLMEKIKTLQDEVLQTNAGTFYFDEETKHAQMN